jgi:hypothetical protein
MRDLDGTPPAGSAYLRQFGGPNYVRPPITAGRLSYVVSIVTVAFVVR